MRVRPARIATAARARIAVLAFVGVAAALALGGCGFVLPSKRQVSASARSR